MKLYFLILCTSMLSILTTGYVIEKYEYAKFLFSKAKEYHYLFNDVNHSLNKFENISINFYVYVLYVLVGCNNFLYSYKKEYRKLYNDFLIFNNVDIYNISKQFSY